MISRSPMESIDKGLRTLQYLGDAGAGGLSLAQLASKLSLNKASLHLTLSALRHRAFVEKDGRGIYRLGPALLAVADCHLRDESLKGLLHDALESLCLKVNETCHLGVLTGEQVVYVDKVEPLRSLRIWSQIGWRNPVLTTALGRAILCYKYLDVASFTASVPKDVPIFTPRTRNSLQAVWQELVDARKRGYSLDEQETELGLTCMAVAILRGGRAIAAISISGPSERMNARHMEFLASSIREWVGPKLPESLTLQQPLTGRRPSRAQPARAGLNRK